MKVSFVDLGVQHKVIQKEINQAIRSVIKRSDFILGEDVRLFEDEFAGFFGKRFAVGVNSGTDALFLGLLSLGIGPGDEVIVPAFTYIATSLAVTLTGARPAFVDINEETYNIDVDKIKSLVNKRTKAIIPVHLYGQPADMKPILDIAETYNLKIIEDTAQAHGSRYKISADKWILAGTIGDLGCFSFYPTKNLGALGDGGIIITDDENVYRRLLMLRDYGRRSRYEHVTVGYNSRLDTLQAAILRVKLRHLNEWNDLRRKNALIYANYLKDADITLPLESDYGKHVYHIYAAKVKKRDVVLKEFAENNVGVLVHYPIPLHLQEVYKDLGYSRGDFPVSERVSAEILSLPMHPYLKEAQIEFVAGILKKVLG